MSETDSTPLYNLQCPISDYIGYGLVGTNLAIHSIKTNKNINVYPIHTYKDIRLEHNKYAGQIQSLVLNGRNQPNPKLTTIKIWHQDDMMTRVGYGPMVGWPIFELNRLNNQEKCQLAIPDELIVCSQWAKGIINSEIPSQVVNVVPLAVDTDIFHPVDYNPNKFIFFSSGKWEVRKNQDLIRSAFIKAFGNNPDVELWMNCHNWFYDKGQMEAIYNRFTAPNIKYVGPFKTQRHLARVMQQTSCGVFPSRAEGWDFALMEMMACGKEVIASNYSAHTEFCNEDNSILIEPKGLEPAHDGQWFHGTGDWAIIDEDDLISAMKMAHSKGHTHNAQGIKTCRDDFTWEKTFNKCVEIST